jgi:hypothetical protein
VHQRQSAQTTVGTTAWFPTSAAGMCVRSALILEPQGAGKFIAGHSQKGSNMNNQEKNIDDIYDDLFVNKTDGTTRYERVRFNAIKKRYLETYGGEENFYVQRRRWDKGFEKPDADYEEFKKIEKKIWTSVLEEGGDLNNESK